MMRHKATITQITEEYRASVAIITANHMTSLADVKVSIVLSAQIHRIAEAKMEEVLAVDKLRKMNRELPAKNGAS